MNPHDLADFAITNTPEGVSLLEFKYMEDKTDYFSTRNKVIIGSGKDDSKGFGIRVLLNGAWGFSATDKLTKESVSETIKRAVKLAKAASLCNPHVTLTEEPIVVDTVENPIKIDPFHVELEEKLEHFVTAEEAARVDPAIQFTNSVYVAAQDYMVFYNSSGTKIDQRITWNGGYVTMTASGNGDTQTRKFKDDMFSTRGWESMKEFDLVGQIPEKAKELVKLLEAPQMKPGRADIILNPSQLGIQLHESCGHPTELDRALGYEAAYAGTSFLKPNLLKENFMYGNEKVTIHADATIPGAIGTFYYDHEGVKAKKLELVKEGVFNDYLSSRETALKIGRKDSGGTMRSNGYDKIPLIRMTNIVLQPDKTGYSLDEMIAETKDGYYFNTNRSWSIDDIRLNFQFGCEVGYRIEKGEITGLVKNPTYTGITNEFWNSVSAVGRPDEMEVLGTPFCGKGEPGQTMYTGHGGPPTRFSNVQVGLLE